MHNFENPAAMSGAEINTEKAEAFPARHERETVPEIMESARLGRAGLLDKIFSRTTADVVAGLVPGIDAIGFAASAATGRTFAKTELTSRERMTHAAVAGALTLAYAFRIADMHHAGVATRVTASVIASIGIGPEFIRETAAIVAQRFPKAANIMDAVGEYLQDKRGQVAGAAHEMHRIFSDRGELVSLGLDNL